MSGDYKNSIDYYNQAIKIDPNYKGAYNNKGNALLTLGDCTKAIDCYNQVIRIDPDYKDAYNNKGIAL